VVRKHLQSLFETFYFIRARSWLLTICLAAFLMSSGMGLTNPILSLYVQSFTTSASLVGFFFTTFALGRVLVTIPVSVLSDKLGRKVPIITGALIEALGSLGVAIAPDYNLLIITRLLQGVGSGLFTTGLFLVVADLSATEERGRINSLFQGSILLGLTVSPAFGGLLADMFGIRVPLVGVAALALIAGFLIIFRFPDHLGKSNLHVSSVRHHPDTKDRSFPIFALFRDRNFSLITSVAFLIFVVRAGARDTLMPLLGYNELGLDITAIGLLFTLIALFNLFAIPIAGMLSDSRGRKPVIIIGLLITGIALGLIGMSEVYLIFLFGALLLGVGKGFGEPISVVYMTDISSPRRYGTAFGVFLTMRDSGLMLGPVLLGWLADLYGLRLPFLLNALLLVGMTLVFALLASETLRRRKSEAVEGSD
jgi:MFS transporter, DHA1 family, multidrug resistance protein